MKKLMKLQLLVIAFVLLIAGSAFASLSYNVSVDTTSLNGQDGYLYFQYIPVSAVNSTATVSSFATDGTLGAQSANVVDGSAVSGTLPGNVVFANTNGINDYNHAIHFGNMFNFNLLFASTPGAPAGGSSTFSLGLFSDEGGTSSLLGGTLYTISLMNDGTATVQTLASQASVNPAATPIPAAAWLLGSGLMGLIGIRRKLQN